MASNPESTSPVPPKRSRWRFVRFSLGSLLLFVLLVGAGATAWWRWNAWVLVHEFRVNEDFHGSAYLANGGSSLVLTGAGWNDTAVFHAGTGAQNIEGRATAVSPDGRWALRNDYDSKKLQLIKVGSPTPTPLADVVERELSGRFSPDSRLLMIVLANNAVRILSLENGKDVFVTEEQGAGVSQYGFTPDNALAYALGADGSLRCWEATTGKLHGESRERRFHVQHVIVSPDSKLLLAGCSDAQMRVYSLPDLKTQLLLGGLEDYLYTAAFSDDMNLIATSTWGGSVRIWSLRNGDDLAKLKTLGMRANALAFSPDGKRLITGDADGAGRVWNTTGRQVLHLPAEIDSVYFDPPTTVKIEPLEPNPAEPDPEPQFIDDGVEKPIEAAWKAKEDAFTGHNDQIRDVRYIAGGTMIVTHSSDGTIRLWDAETGEGIRPSASGMPIAVTPDGLRVALKYKDAKAYEIWECRRKHGDNRLVAQPELLFGGAIFLLMLLNAYRAFKGARA